MIAAQPFRIEKGPYGGFSIQMLADLVLVQRQRRETTSTGLVFAKSMQDVQYGMVLAVGPGCLELKAGDAVCFAQTTGQPMFYANDRFDQNAQERDFLVMHESHIFGVMEDL